MPIIYSPILHILIIITIIPFILPTPISNFLNNRLIVRRSCTWSVRKTQNQSNILSYFFTQRQGECLYALSESDKEMYLIIQMKDEEDGQMRELILNAKMLSNVMRQTIKYGKQLTISFKDPNSLHLYQSSLKFQQQMNKKKAIITFPSSHNKLTISFPKIITIQYSLTPFPLSYTYNEQLIIIWLVFIFLNYQWFYFNKNDGVILREYKSIKKGWCFKVVSLFWINHTSFPLSFNHQFQKFAEYIHTNKSQMLQISLLLVLMIGILIFIGFQMGRLMKKVSFRSKESLHIREVVDYILIFAILVIPFEYVLILMPISKFLQICYLLTLQQSHYISYYQQYGKVVLDWVEGMYFTLYNKNFAQVQSNYIAAAFILSIFIIQIMIFLMELFSHHEFRELKTMALSIYMKLATFFMKIQSKRAEIDKCSICLQSFSSYGGLEILDDGKNQIFQGVNIAVTKCNHRFHSNCLEKWFRDGNQTCPLDRQNLKKIKKVKSRSRSKE